VRASPFRVFATLPRQDSCTAWLCRTSAIRSASAQRPVLEWLPESPAVFHKQVVDNLLPAWLKKGIHGRTYIRVFFPDGQPFLVPPAPGAVSNIVGSAGVGKERLQPIVVSLQNGSNL
jgi:hypothetical protein